MKRIRYISSFAEAFTEDSIQKLVEKAQKHNEKKRITGMLVAGDSLFYQMIEGPDREIDALFKRILKDPRHRDILLLSAEHGDLDRLCPDWSMLKVDLYRVEHERFAPVQAHLNKVIAQRRVLVDALSDLEEFTMRAFMAAETAEDQD